MGKSKTRQRRISNRRGMLAICLVVSILLGILIHENQSLQTRLSNYDAKATAIQEQIENEEARTEELDATKKYMQTDAYAEEAAREKLGLVKDNEIVFSEQE